MLKILIASLFITATVSARVTTLQTCQQDNKTIAVKMKTVFDPSISVATPHFFVDELNQTGDLTNTYQLSKVDYKEESLDSYNGDDSQSLFEDYYLEFVFDILDEDYDKIHSARQTQIKQGYLISIVDKNGKEFLSFIKDESATASNFIMPIICKQ